MIDPTMPEIQSYIRDEDRQKFRNFIMQHIRRFFRPNLQEVWHYTNADGLIGILKSKQIWSTQIACLNDTLEQRFFGDLVHDAAKKRQAENKDQDLAVLLRVADEALSTRDYSTEGYFVACFSEVEDDLNQWRGYGGGECGYSVGFSSDGIFKALKHDQNDMLLPMNYDEALHKSLVQDVIKFAEDYFLQGLKDRKLEVAQWAREFFTAVYTELEIFACIIKHSKFSGEVERRIAKRLQPHEHQYLEFRQKHTLLARHLPIDLTNNDNNSVLPITRIYVGPGPSQDVTRISVGDLLLKYNHQHVTVEKSKVPFRIT